MRLYKANIQHLALVDRPASRHGFDLLKRAGGGMAFTLYVPFVVEKAAAGEVAGLAFCRPHETDVVGDYAEAEDLRHMKDTFERNGQTLNLQHKMDLRPDQAQVIKSEIRGDGSWYVRAKIFDAEIAKACRDRVYTGFSVGGTCEAKAAPQTVAEERAELLALLERIKRTGLLLGLDFSDLDAKREKDDAYQQALDVIWDSRPGFHPRNYTP